MSQRLRQIVAWWFVLQIVLPFTAPLQTLELRDLFGPRPHRATASSPESTTTPTMRDAAPSAAQIGWSSAAPAAPAVRTPRARAVSTRAAGSSRDRRPAPPVQRSVLRL